MSKELILDLIKKMAQKKNQLLALKINSEAIAGNWSWFRAINAQLQELVYVIRVMVGYIEKGVNTLCDIDLLLFSEYLALSKSLIFDVDNLLLEVSKLESK